MHNHDHATTVRTATDFGTETEWAEWVRDYYRDIETYDWVDVADNLRGPEALFHRNRRRTVRRLLSRYGAQSPMLDAGCGCLRLGDPCRSRRPITRSSLTNAISHENTKTRKPFHQTFS